MFELPVQLDHSAAFADLDRLLVTKLCIPPARASLVPRPRLTARLTEALGRKLILLAAPAGSGKTTALVDWWATQAGAGADLAWLALDDADNDPVRFWTYAIGALETVYPGIGEPARAMLVAPQSPLLEWVLTPLINALATIPEDLVLVLDDYHLITTPAIHDSLLFLLDHIPPRMHLVLTARHDPPLPLARLRARGELAEFRSPDLRFTGDEAAGLLAAILGAAPAPEHVALLEARTEGWAAGLQLAALALQGRANADEFIQAFTGSHRYIVSYLAEEVLNRLPETTQTFLLQTAILDRLSGPLCDAVTGQADGAALLETLEAASLFTTALDETGQWYRYHHLFAEVLRHRLMATQAALVPELHRRAATWFAAQGLPRAAVPHALAAGDTEQAAALVEQQAVAMLGHSEVTTLLGWLDALPAALVAGRPRLALAGAWALLIQGQAEGAQTHLRALEQALAARDAAPGPPAPDRAALHGEALALRALLAVAVGYATTALDLGLQAHAAVPADNRLVHSFILYALGQAYRLRGDSAQAARMLTDAATLGQAVGNLALALYALYSLSGMQEVQGRLHETVHTQQEALRLATGRDGRPLPLAGLAHVSWAKVLREWNDLAGALQHLEAGLALGRQGGIDGIGVDCGITRALVYQAQGRDEAALESLAGAEQILKAVRDEWTLLRVATFRARLHLAQGRLDAAVRWARESGFHIDDALREELEIEYLTLVRVLLAEGRLQPGGSSLGDALTLLQRLGADAAQAGRHGRIIEIGALKALARAAQGDTAQARLVLAEVLARGEPEGYVRTFADEGAPMAVLLAELRTRPPAGQGFSLAYLDKLIAAFGGVAGGGAARAANSALVEPLSDRELEVLRLVAAGLKNQEIADRLVVVLGTVKAHINSIYGKLGVSSRVQAVSRARELNLL